LEAEKSIFWLLESASEDPATTSMKSSCKSTKMYHFWLVPHITIFLDIDEKVMERRVYFAPIV
jgi:hypothetical protein